MKEGSSVTKCKMCEGSGLNSLLDDDCFFCNGRGVMERDEDGEDFWENGEEGDVKTNEVKEDLRSV